MTNTTVPTLDPAATGRLVRAGVTMFRAADFRARVERVIAEIALPETYRIVFERDKVVPDGRFYLQVACQRPDTFTGVMGEGRGGKAYLSEHATDSELVQTVWGLYQSYVMHEARETFLYKGRRVYGPHIDVDALWEVAERYDARQHLDLNPATDTPTANTPDHVRRLIDDQQDYEASARDRAARARAAAAERGDETGGSAGRLEEQADAHRQVAFVLGTLPFVDVEDEIRARLAEKREDLAAADATGDADRIRQAAVLVDIWVCALNQVTDAQRERANA